MAAGLPSACQPAKTEKLYFLNCASNPDLNKYICPNHLFLHFEML